jgi:dGTPase
MTLYTNSVIVVSESISLNLCFKYSNIDDKQHYLRRYKNKIIYNIENEIDYKQAIIDYISGMSDNYAIKAYNELIEF